MKYIITCAIILGLAGLAPAPVIDPDKSDRHIPTYTEAERTAQQGLQGTTPIVGTVAPAIRDEVPLPPNDPKAAEVVAGLHGLADSAPVASPPPVSGPNYVAILLCLFGGGILIYLVRNHLQNNGQ